MRKYLLTILAVCTLFAAFSQAPAAGIFHHPRPCRPHTRQRQLHSLPRTIIIEAVDQQGLSQILKDLKARLSIPTGYTVTISQQPQTAAVIHLTLNKTTDAALGEEGYDLTVTPSRHPHQSQQACRPFLWRPDPSAAAA